MPQKLCVGRSGYFFFFFLNIPKFVSHVSSVSAAKNGEVAGLRMTSESFTLVLHIQHKTFAIVLLTIYLDEAPSAITILALFPENKKAVAKLEFPEN
jgi:hypothetical protein